MGALRTFLLIGCTALAVVCWPDSVQAQPGEDNDLVIATGSITGVYHALASAICRLLVLEEEASAPPCEPVPTQGSVANIAHLRWGNADFAIVQADLQEEAYVGNEPFQGQPFTDLRHVATLHPEMLTILQRPGTDVVGALEGRSARPPRVFLGVGGSGTRALARLAADYGFESGSFDLVTNVSSALSVDALCAGRLDAIFYLIGHPNDLTNQATRQCGAELVAADGAISAEVVAEERHFQNATIPGGLYPAAPEDLATIGVRATLVAKDDTPDDLVSAVLKALHDHNDQLRRLHLAFVEMDPDDLAMACNTAPLHPAAQRFFDEHGLEMAPCA